MKVFLLALSLFLCSITQAATYYISPTGNDATGTGTITNPWKTLFKATSTVTAAGNIIHILPGTYTETQTSNLRAGVSLEGEGVATTIILGNMTGQWSNLLSLDSPQNTNGNQSISGFTINGQYVSESNFRTWIGIWISGRSNVNVHDMRIINFYYAGAIYDGFDATSPMSDPGVSATGNKFNNNDVDNCATIYNGSGSGCLNIGGQTGMEILNNTIVNVSRVNFKNGWPIKYWDNGYLKGCKINNNILKKSPYVATYWGENGDWDFAIELFNISGLEIGYNQIQGAVDLNYNHTGNYAYSVWAHHNILDHVTPNYTHPESGFILEFATVNGIFENNIINNAFVGISYNLRSPNNHGGYTYPCPTGGCSEVSGNIIRNNLFTNLYQAPYGASGAVITQTENGTNDPFIDGFSCYNNTFIAKSTQGAPVGLDFTSQNNGTVRNVNIRNNIFQGFTNRAVTGNTAGTQSNILITHNNAYQTAAPTWTGGGVTINNNLAVNPLFVGNGYFTLQATSPCIDAGVNVGLPYSGNAPDMGYAEYSSATNTPPTANAGPDQTITLPTSSVSLSGSGTDPDGNITAYQWTKIAGPTAGTITTPTAAATTVTGLVAGTYRFELRVTDNGGAFGRDTMQVIVNAAPNTPPTANAGPDQTITLPTSTATLSGSGTDPDGNITAYQWTKIAGPTAGTITTPAAAGTTVTGLVQGIYRFELRVTDNGGAFGRDTVQITVNAAGNIPPVANAGADQTITLPTNSTTLSGIGVDPDGNITAYQWTKIAGPTAGTITTPTAASTTITALVQGVYRFELRVTDNNGALGRDTVQITVNPAAPNTAPTASAGADQTITLPTNSIILSGSGNDPDGIITAYQWTKVSGPAAGTIANPTTAATAVTGLVQGTYLFELRVTDNNGAFGRDTVQVTVNPQAANVPPTANAGPDQTITLPTSFVILSGSGTDPDGIITAYQWTKISGPASGNITNPTVAATSVTGLSVGTYQFELRVTDNNGAFGRDTIRVIVNTGATNTPPTANAGPDQTIVLPTNTAILSGSGNDPDGTISAYQWTKVSGPAAGTITNPTTAATSVTGLVAGTYQFELLVTDNIGATDRDTMQVIVTSTPNTAPTANAGPDQIIVLPTNSITLSGSGNDPDGNITAYLWTKIAGPAAGTITTPGAASTGVTGLVAGVYRFELRVTDNNGAFGRDTVQITVNNASNIPPVANAGADQTITLPTNAVTLTGIGIDPDGTIAAYQWTKIAGPAAGTITNNTTASTTVTGLTQGVYRFELRVTDNNGAFGRDTVQIMVNPAAANNPPTANAGPDQTIALPVNSVILSGSGTDTDGFITAYQWTKIAGPAAGTITNPTVAATSVTGLVVGTYRFELRVTDNNGAFGRDTIQVIVNPGATNTAPIANAGPDQTIVLPTNTVILSGSGTDPDGTITAYLWTKIAGPAAGTIVNPNVAATAVSGLTAGTYRFELRVTDNAGAFGRDTVQVIVTSTPNTPPTANAGPDQTITLPTNSVILSGSGTDPDGTVVAYLWTKIAGPAAGTITNPTVAATAVTGMVVGTYRFELRVTDNNGAFGRDTIQVIVNPGATNTPPAANAGPDQTIVLPANTVILSGSGVDPDGTITAYLWSQVSGPAAASITNPNAAATSVTGLVQGVYRFELRVTDNSGAFGRDTVQITVNPTAANQPPVANAGADQNFDLPNNNTILSGTGTDPDGIVVAYSWTKISGPAAIITNPFTPATSVTGLTQGVYQFELTVTDNNGATGKDTVQVTVNAANVAPVANAGADQVLTLPTNATTLAGSGTDSDGSIVSYEWLQLSGPSNNVLSSVNTANTNLSNLVEGVYVFELTVRDNKGATGKDIVTVLVIAAPVQGPGDNEARIYPNPVTDFATLEIRRIAANTKPTIIIVDANGRKVFAKELNNASQQNFTERLDLRTLVKGAYFAFVQFPNGELRSIKLIKQ